MTKLSVNINKIATIRNARGGNTPNLVKAAINCQNFGADGITIHPRPDERHITKKDVYDIKPIITTEYNIEGYPTEDFIKMVLEIRPDQVTLVPDGPNVLTSCAGWDTIKFQDYLKEIISIFKEKSVRTSIFVDPVEAMIEGAKNCGTDRIELYTEDYAKGYSNDREKAIAPYVGVAKIANELGLEINAGHDLNLNNLHYLVEMGNINEVSIGHAIIVDSLHYGFEETISKYLEIIRK